MVTGSGVAWPQVLAGLAPALPASAADPDQADVGGWLACAGAPVPVECADPGERAMAGRAVAGG